MSDERDPPKRVMVTTRKFHTLRGLEHPEGEVYEVDADQVANLLAQGLITDPAAPPETAPAPSQPVEPMTTENTPAVVPPPEPTERS
jgi:hypothetical protein